MSTATASVGRNARRRQRNRARLVAAAREAMARKGVDATTISEITEAADLALGTFYNYFESKDEVLDAVVSEIIEDLGLALDELTQDLEDRALAVAISVRHVLRLAAEDSIWGWFVVRNERASDTLQRHLGHRGARDLRRGVAEGRFRVPDADSALVALGGIVLMGIRTQLGGLLPEGADRTLVACALQMLGLAPAEALELASRPLPKVTRASGA